MTDPHVIEHVPVAEDVTLHVRRWDGGDRRPVLLVHGLASNARLWDGVAANLHASGHPVAAVDQRGHGRSSKPDGGYDMAGVVEDLRRLVGHLADQFGWHRPLVAGQSWGGNVVVELAATHPGLAAGVVGVDGGTIELAERFESWEACAAALRPPPMAGTPLADLERMLRSSHPDWPESGIQGTLACFEVRDDGTIAPWLTLDRHLLVLRGLWEHRPSQRFDRIADPVLLLGADPGPAESDWHRDKVRAHEAAAAALGDARVEWLRGDHDLHAQHPERVAELLTRFADEIES
ncbi:alpha/beta hydrolase [Acidimicrobiia bacterium EGI L10123]|uniref:alpha/beta fold hydrolase n=1 Tax=Salinilacustrithrix flava TaxID=2957203 RepID=UPI003D7C2B4E|nr:alpha/beta hydrolase [Acidimicrobiia bacterium EGI L10123]